MIILDYDYCTLDARKEIKNKIVRIYSNGMVAITNEYFSKKLEDKIYKKYGFKYIYSCLASSCDKNYNRIIEEHLNKRNGLGWREKIKAELKAAYEKVKAKQKNKGK